MNNTQKSLSAILICYFSWGLFPIYFKLLKSIGAYEVLAMRILCSFIFMILVVGIAKNKKTIFEEIIFNGPHHISHGSSMGFINDKDIFFI